MSWGSPPQGHNPYYGQPGPQPGAPPPAAVYNTGPAPGAQYGQPPQGYQHPPQGYSGAPPPQQQQHYGAPQAQPQQRYGAPPTQQHYGSAPPGGAPPPGGYEAGGYGAGGYQAAQAPGAAPGQQPYGGYGAQPQAGGYRPPGPPMGGGFAPSPAPPPPAGVSPELWNWFQAVDVDRSGQITAQELQNALMNGNWTPFNQETCRLMIGMFDKDRSGTINVHEFVALWKYIQDWKQCFDRFDMDRSGNINANELLQAFSTFGYNLSPQFCQLCVRVHDRHNANSMKFDDFIQCCVMLKMLTDQFRQKDTQQQGVININYEEFLHLVLDNAIVK